MQVVDKIKLLSYRWLKRNMLIAFTITMVGGLVHLQCWALFSVFLCLLFLLFLWICFVNIG